jgi:DNA-binding CsgD family transcriptional regulator
MASAMAFGRARSDIDVTSRAGLPLDRFMDEAATVLRSVVPCIAACLATLDPGTAMITSVRKIGELENSNSSDLAWAQIEYGSDDITATRAILASRRVAVGVHEATGGDVSRSVRMAQLLLPVHDFHDEARVVFADRTGAWGTVSMFRGGDDPTFTPDEVAFLASVATAFTRGIRTGLLARAGLQDAAAGTGPAVIIFDAQDHVTQSTPGAQAQLERMSTSAGRGDPLTMVQALVSAARRMMRGQLDYVPRIRVRTSDGVWLVLHAAPLNSESGPAGSIVVTIEEARPQEVVDLVAAAFGLTARERDVTGMVLRGADTKAIAAAMHVSPYTVQDHLKSIFDKAQVASRRELVARVYVDQYATRLGHEVDPSGWFRGWTTADPHPAMVSSTAATAPSR